jgi:hypothetical protein
MKNTIIVVLVGLLMAAGLVFLGCGPGEGCIGNGECTITIGQGDGLYWDKDAPYSSCGKGWYYDSDYNKKSGCVVEDYKNNDGRKYGTFSCDC